MNRARILKKFMTFANKIVKKRKLILFNSYPAYSDNALALFEYIMDKRKDIVKSYEIIWGQDKNDEVPKYLSKYNIKNVDKKSPKGIWTYLRAKYIFSTHGYFSGVESGKNQIQVNLWHGCGYKAITDYDRCYLGDYTIATSEIYKKIQATFYK